MKKAQGKRLGQRSIGPTPEQTQTKKTCHERVGDSNPSIPILDSGLYCICTLTRSWKYASGKQCWYCTDRKNLHHTQVIRCRSSRIHLAYLRTEPLSLSAPSPPQRPPHEWPLPLQQKVENNSHLHIYFLYLTSLDCPPWRIREWI